MINRRAGAPAAAGFMSVGAIVFFFCAFLILPFSCSRSGPTGQEIEGVRESEAAGAMEATGAPLPPPAVPAETAPPPRGTAAVPVRFKLAPPDATLVENGSAIRLSAGGNGARIAELAPGAHMLVLSAAGYDTRVLRVVVGSKGAQVQEKLERSPSPLRLAGMVSTGLRPKSVAFTPDGRFIIAPLLSGRGADIVDASSLKMIGRLEPPAAYAKSEGFVESAVLPSLRELWVSQMHSSTIHVFDLDSFAYKASFPSGGSYPKVIAASADERLAFVSNWVSEDVSIIDAATHAVSGRVKVGGTPRGLAATADGRYLYIARFSGGSILRLSLADRRLETFYAADGGAKRHLVLDEKRNRLYATDMARDSLFVFDTSTGDRIAEVHLGPNPNTCALSPDGGTIYACTRGSNGPDGYEKEGPDAGELIAVDTESLSVVARQWGGDQPTGLAVSPDGRRVVFSDFLDARLEVYDASAR
jgi:YVTN family beta-propeller protein